MIINRSLRFSTSTFTRQLRFNKLPQPTLRRLNYQIMSVSNTPHPVSSSSEPPKAAVGLEPVTAGASATPAPASAPAVEAKDKGKGKEAKQPKPKKEKAEGAPNGAADSAKPKKEKPAPSGPLELSPPPGYFDERIKIFDEYKAKYDAEVAAKPRDSITISLPDGTKIEGKSWETSPLDVAKGISQSLAEKVIIAKVQLDGKNDEELWDLDRPLEKSCSLKLLDFDSEDNDYEARQVFWHSSAHVMGEACERRFEGCCLGYGPPLPEGGFFYDMSLADGKTLGPDDYKQVEDVAKIAVKEKQPFERLELPKEVLLAMFKYNKYKQHYIKDKVPDGTSSTVYRCGPLIDLCLGPHVPHTGRIKTIAVTKNSSSYFLGDAKNDVFQRLYGISFPDSKKMTEYKKYMEEAAKRDHRRIGREQELFVFHDLSPGSAFFLPLGMRIYNTLLEFMKSEYRKRGFHEVGSPNIFNSKLWETSGHWQNYSEDMFQLQVDEEKFAVKPMNCPGHALIFDARERSYKELPLRLAEFGVLHRNEASGALSGLTRVRRFVQDDAHIFCTVDQVEQEIQNAFDFLDAVYKPFGFNYKVGLSTRNPSKWMGDLAVWDKAESALQSVLEKRLPGQWKMNPEDAAFYGPKLDFELEDALKRKWQCGTIQLDFNLPERFNLRYRGPNQSGESSNTSQFERPVMIHRAILGSLERFIAIITENFAGRWPFWLNPKQVMVVPVAMKYAEYANKVAQAFKDAGLFAEVDESANTLPKMIRNAQMGQWSFIMVVGEKEQETESVTMRNRDNEDQKGQDEGSISLQDAVDKLVSLQKSRASVAKFD